MPFLYDADKDPGDLFIVTPMLCEAKQVSGMAIDLRLGNEFVLPVRSRYALFDPDANAPDNRRYSTGDIEHYQDRIYRAFGQPFILHPGEFVLGCTFEYVQFPNNLGGQIVGRSSWGRLGLNIATATAVAPGYSGVLTLELVNHGSSPIITAAA